MRPKALSIIQYQNVSKNSHVHRLWLSVNAFERQMEYLLANGFQVLSMEEAIHYMERKEGITHARPVSLTFDNGYQEFYEHVFPQFTQYRLPGTVFISPPRAGTSVNIGTSQAHYLSWSLLKELTNHRMTIGAYEDYAWNINDIPQDLVQKHIIEYKKILEDKLGKEIRYFGVKEGVPNHRIRDLLISQGYKSFLTQCPTNRRPDLFSIGRIQVDDDDFNIFLTKISRTYLFFKDKKSWKYIRKYGLDKVAHRLSETYDRLRGKASY